MAQLAMSEDFDVNRVNAANAQECFCAFSKVGALCEAIAITCTKRDKA